MLAEREPNIFTIRRLSGKLHAPAQQSRGQSLRYPFNRRLIGPQDSVWSLGEAKNCSALPNIVPWFPSLLSRRYTVYVIPAFTAQTEQKILGSNPRASLLKLKTRTKCELKSVSESNRTAWHAHHSSVWGSWMMGKLCSYRGQTVI
jgi:hypothetical protein